MELLDISEEDLAETDGEIASNDSEETDGTVEGTPGRQCLPAGMPARL